MIGRQDAGLRRRGTLNLGRLVRRQGPGAHQEVEALLAGPFLGIVAMVDGEHHREVLAEIRLGRHDRRPVDRGRIVCLRDRRRQLLVRRRNLGKHADVQPLVDVRRRGMAEQTVSVMIDLRHLANDEFLRAGQIPFERSRRIGLVEELGHHRQQFVLPKMIDRLGRPLRHDGPGVAESVDELRAVFLDGLTAQRSIRRRTDAGIGIEQSQPHQGIDRRVLPDRQSRKRLRHPDAKRGILNGEDLHRGRQAGIGLRPPAGVRLFVEVVRDEVIRLVRPSCGRESGPGLVERLGASKSPAAPTQPNRALLIEPAAVSFQERQPGQFAAVGYEPSDIGVAPLRMSRFRGNECPLKLRLRRGPVEPDFRSLLQHRYFGRLPISIRIRRNDRGPFLDVTRRQRQDDADDAHRQRRRRRRGRHEQRHSLRSRHAVNLPELRIAIVDRHGPPSRETKGSCGSKRRPGDWMPQLTARQMTCKGSSSRQVRGLADSGASRAT